MAADELRLRLWSSPGQEKDSTVWLAGRGAVWPAASGAMALE